MSKKRRIEKSCMNCEEALYHSHGDFFCSRDGSKPEFVIEDWTYVGTMPCGGKAWREDKYEQD